VEPARTSGCRGGAANSWPPPSGTPGPLARPDVALVDIRMPPTHTGEGLVAAQTIRAEHPRVFPVIAYEDVG
jgi:DNA-binding NarL/FixJ family response regulator